MPINNKSRDSICPLKATVQKPLSLVGQSGMIPSLYSRDEYWVYSAAVPFWVWFSTHEVAILDLEIPYSHHSRLRVMSHDQIVPLTHRNMRRKTFFWSHFWSFPLYFFFEAFYCWRLQRKKFWTVSTFPAYPITNNFKAKPLKNEPLLMPKRGKYLL